MFGCGENGFLEHVRALRQDREGMGLGYALDQRDFCFFVTTYLPPPTPFLEKEKKTAVAMR